MTDLETINKKRTAAFSPLPKNPLKDLHPRKMFDTISITGTEFEEIRTLVYNHFGINLTEKKRALVEGRLQKVIKSLGMKSFRQYIDYLKKDLTGKALAELSNRISTNHTFFFREAGHFDFFSHKILPEFQQQALIRPFRMWCAGCSFGDEPYSFAIALMEFFGSSHEKMGNELLATDISLDALESAETGIYPEDRLKLVPPWLKQKYFARLPDGSWQVCDRLRRQVHFERMNFISSSYPISGTFHIISCRNVMIYFDQRTREILVKRFYDYTKPGGYLFIGHSETLPRDNPYFSYVQPAIYKKTDK